MFCPCEFKKGDITVLNKHCFCYSNLSRVEQKNLLLQGPIGFCLAHKYTGRPSELFEASMGDTSVCISIGNSKERWQTPHQLIACGSSEGVWSNTVQKYKFV